MTGFTKFCAGIACGLLLTSEKVRTAVLGLVVAVWETVKAVLGGVFGPAVAAAAAVKKAVSKTRPNTSTDQTPEETPV